MSLVTLEVTVRLDRGEHGLSLSWADNGNGGESFIAYISYDELPDGWTECWVAEEYICAAYGVA